GGKTTRTDGKSPGLLRFWPHQQRRSPILGGIALEALPEQPVELYAGSDTGRRERRITGGEIRLERRHRLLFAGNPRLMGSNIKADAGALHAVRHGSGETHILIAGNDIDAVLLALAMQLGTQRLPDTMRDDGILEGVGELRRRH